MADFFAGVDLGGTKILTVVVDKNRNLLGRTKIPTEAESGVTRVFSNISASIYSSCKEAGIAPEKLSGIGIGVPGPVDPESGLVYDCPNLSGWKDIEVKKILSDEFKVPVAVENDARVAGLAETRIGAARGCNHVFYITVSTGIGAAIIVDGRIYHGFGGGAGEFGRMRLLNRDIMERSFSGPSIERLFGIPATALAALLEKGDPGAEKALEFLTNGLGIFLANVTTLLNPEIIVIGGGVSSLGETLLAPVRRIVSEYAFSISARQVKIVRAGLGTESGAFGAAELLFANN